MISSLINIYYKEKLIKMANIKNNKYRKIDCRIINDYYMDFMLSNDESNDNIYALEGCLASQLDFFGHSNKYVVSKYAWQDSVISNSILKNIGYTGVDNGFITYEKDKIGNDEFLDLYTNSTFDLSTHGDKFFVNEVNGNTGMYVYPIEINEEYTAFKGGFYQGFFKINGDKYQTLPNRIKNEWNFNITLRKKNYETQYNIVNKRHEDNKGIFLYIGTRSENKFFEMYKTDDKLSDLISCGSDGYSLDYDIDTNHVIECQYSNINDNLNACDNGYFMPDDYLKEQFSLKDVNLTDSKGNKIGEKGFYEIETDNKFIIFNNTTSGFNKNTWNEYTKFVLTGKKDCPNINYFPYLNNTSNGFVKDNIEQILDEHSYSYDVFKDIEYNALGFKINDDGSISYRYLIEDNNIIEEKTKPGIVLNDGWYNIHIKLVNKNKTTDICNETYKQAKMQIFIYVNGYLKLISKELPELNLKPLNDTQERQEGIPFNISIGGGTQGLSERILLDYYNITKYTLPLERHFCGSFIGDIKTFKFSDCYMDLNTIRTF